MAEIDSSPSSSEIHAEPTKDFFISMLIRDIGLIPAIADLVDNCVDGARRLRPSADSSSVGRFSGLWVRISYNTESFLIEDNCGGIAWQVARDYAFRFGRPEDAPITQNSIGQFGIGMKRALFKIGGAFTVTSTTEAEQFDVTVDVAKWRKTADWKFDRANHVVNPTELDNTGTKITVSKLHSSVLREFELQRFESALSNEISKFHQQSMAEGLQISLNGVPVDKDVASLLSNDSFRPAYNELALSGENASSVTVRIYTGIADSSPSEAGWYIYCNGRLVLGPDRTEITGWGTNIGSRMPQYHNQYARFRGYAFFDSEDVASLPWTTTKEGVDRGHPIYRTVLPKLAQEARPVITFLNDLDAEKDDPDENPLQVAVTAAEHSPVPVGNIKATGAFSAPRRAQTRIRPDTQSIQYKRRKVDIERAKEILDVSTAREVGESTFDYFLEREG